MKTIVITVPYFFKGEDEVIRRMLENEDIWRLHIRKPEASEEELRQLLSSIPLNFRPRISIHTHSQLALEYGLGGIHLNKRNHKLPQGWKGLVSKSIHSIDEIKNLSSNIDYAFLSPIFTSISKPGYFSAFQAEDLRGNVTEKIIALGGVTPERFNFLEEFSR